MYQCFPHSLHQLEHSAGIRRMFHLEYQVRRWKGKQTVLLLLFWVWQWQPLSHPQDTSDGRGRASHSPALTRMAAVTSTFLLIWIIWLVLIRCFDNPEGQRPVSLLIQSSDACRARPPWPSANCGYWLIALVNIYRACCSCVDVCPLRLCVTFKWRL